MEMTSYPPSTFCWFELSTTDAAGAKRFYGELFGWKPQDVPIGGGMTYTMLHLREGKDVAALFQMEDEKRKQGIPSHWLSYISVESADAAAKKASELGGNVVAPPFDVMDVGRMAVVQDPTGGTFALWEGRRHKGAALIFENGANCWVELHTKDAHKAKAFYSALTGWGAQTMDMGGGMLYTVFQNGQSNAGGMTQRPPDQMHLPSHWLPYFAVPDCDQTAARAKALGANVIVPPTDIPKTGRFAVLQDPQGAFLGILQPEPM
jgi:hypothetical protein